MASNGFRSLQHAVYLGEIDVTEQGRNDAALRNAVPARRLQNQSEEPQHRVVAHSTSDFLEYDVMSHRMAGRDRSRSRSLCGASPELPLSRQWPHRAGMAPWSCPLLFSEIGFHSTCIEEERQVHSFLPDTVAG